MKIDVRIFPVIELSSSDEEPDEMEQEAAVLTSGKVDRINTLDVNLKLRLSYSSLGGCAS